MNQPPITAVGIDLGTTYSAVAMLDDHSAHPSLTLHDDVVPLHRAVRLSDVEMVTSLLANMQADILRAILSKQQAPYLYTALHWCAVYGQSDAEDGQYSQIAERLLSIIKESST